VRHPVRIAGKFSFPYFGKVFVELLLAFVLDKIIFGRIILGQHNFQAISSQLFQKFYR
jgi:hypothetical protein